MVGIIIKACLAQGPHGSGECNNSITGIGALFASAFQNHFCRSTLDGMKCGKYNAIELCV